MSELAQRTPFSSFPHQEKQECCPNGYKGSSLPRWKPRSSTDFRCGWTQGSNNVIRTQLLPSWGSSIETVTISGAQGGQALLQARRRQYLQTDPRVGANNFKVWIWALRSTPRYQHFYCVSPQLQVQSGENHLFSFTAFPGVTKSHWLWVGHVHIADPVTVTIKMQCIDLCRPSSRASSFELFPNGQLPPIPLRLPAATGTCVFPSGFMGPSHIDCPVTVRCNYPTACIGNRPHILMAYKVGILTWPKRLAAS